jgi:hypothetical protein
MPIVTTWSEHLFLRNRRPLVQFQPPLSGCSSVKRHFTNLSPAVWGRRETARLPPGAGGFYVGLSLTAKHRTVNADDAGSNPAVPPRSGPWQKGVCTSLSTKTMTVRVRSAPPQDRGRLAETDQLRPEEPKSLARYQERPPK